MEKNHPLGGFLLFDKMRYGCYHSSRPKRIFSHYHGGFDMCQMHGKHAGDGRLAEIKPLAQNLGPRVPTTKLSRTQTQRGILTDSDMPEPGLGQMPGHIAHRQRMTPSRRLFSGGGREPGVRDDVVARARYKIRAGNLEKPAVISDTINCMTVALAMSKTRFCTQCGLPVQNRGNDDHQCPRGCFTPCGAM